MTTSQQLISHWGQDLPGSLKCLVQKIIRINLFYSYLLGRIITVNRLGIAFKETVRKQVSKCTTKWVVELYPNMDHEVRAQRLLHTARNRSLNTAVAHRFLWANMCIHKRRRYKIYMTTYYITYVFKADLNSEISFSNQLSYHFHFMLHSTSTALLFYFTMFIWQHYLN